jgi:hypothetical protein
VFSIALMDQLTKPKSLHENVQNVPFTWRYFSGTHLVTLRLTNFNLATLSYLIGRHYKIFLFPKP